MVFFIVTIPLLVIVGFLIVGAVKAYQKKYYELPFKFELIK